MPTIFIASPFFPPSALPPSQRVRLLVRHLHEWGWNSVVFTVDSHFREDVPDPWMTEIAGDEFRTVQVKAWDQRLTRKFGVGDLGIRMFFGLFRSILQQAKKEKPDLILYPVPPWYIMVMAPFIQRMIKVPYAIDYIDPWIFELKSRNSKAVISQWLARRLEGFAVRNASAIFAVSEGILSDLRKRYPKVTSKPLIAVPYGVEVSDYQSISAQSTPNGRVRFRYTGAVSGKMLPVIDVLLKAMKQVNEGFPLDVLFTGTSYAGSGLVKPVLQESIDSNGVSEFVKEQPSRVGYRKALELGMSADFQLLIGDTTEYYAASKMMGLVASGKPFFALVHANSFPARFLNQLDYQHKILFTPERLGDPELTNEIATGIVRAIREKEDFKPVPVDNPVLLQYTARAMAKTFADTFEKVVP